MTTPPDISDDVAIAAQCHVMWMRSIASVGANPTIDHPGMTAVLTDTPARETMLAIHGTDAGVDGVESFLDWSNGLRPERSVAWSARLQSTTAAMLSAHGFLWFGRPTWMRRQLTEPVDLAGEAVGLATPIDLKKHEDDYLVCLNPATGKLRREMARRWPESIRHFISWSDGRPVGQASVYINRDANAMSVHDAYLHHSARRSGVGFDRVLAPLQHLREEGDRIFVAAEEEGRPLYRMFGFEEIGAGQSWIRFADGDDNLPTESEMAAAAAIGEDRAGAVESAMDDNIRFRNGMSPIELAAAVGSSEAAQSWLDGRIETNIVAAWRLGLRQMVGDIVSDQPPDEAQLAVHRAVVDNDRELLQLLLDSGCDPNVVDERGQTALDLATQLNRYSLAAQLRSRTRQRSRDG